MDPSMREVTEALAASSFECTGEVVGPVKDETDTQEPSLFPMAYDLPIMVAETERRVVSGHEPSSGAIGDNEATPPSMKAHNKVSAGRKRGRREISVSDDEAERAPGLDGGVIDIKNILPPSTKRRATASNYTPEFVSKGPRRPTRSTRGKRAARERRRKAYGHHYHHHHDDDDDEEVSLPSSPPSAVKLPAGSNIFEGSNNKKGRTTSTPAPTTTDNQEDDFGAAKAYMLELAADQDKTKARFRQLKFLNHFLNIRRARVQRELEKQRKRNNELIEEQRTTGLAMTELQKLLLPPSLAANTSTATATTEATPPTASLEYIGPEHGSH